MDVVEEKQPLTTTTGKASPVGLKDDVIHIMDKLTIHQPKQQIISVVGMGGTGKTTLALNVYENPFVKEHFHIRAWAIVSKQYSAKEIFSKLLSSIGQSGSETDLGLKLHQSLWESVGNEIIRLCRGLPLSIVVIGGFLLKSPKTVGFWEDVAKNIKSIPNSTEKQEILDVLFLSYSHLPPHLKPCFLYMGIFREDREIRASRIIKLWVAEGFIKPKRAQMLEEIAEGYLNDLVDRNLVLVGRHRSNGKIRSCRLHDLIRDLCLKVSEKDKFFYAKRAPDNMTKVKEY
ncbi:putative late blight resistance protein homolog R1C-3 [Salvia miltiorrhiza]|uniref:putative late blight resistance protein homolog R1C-3 n=1 Tax=Salvia miltiorrhiza TaxID=226208 RepID=UPI0025AD93C9|nr:putative late blight resistance protein homolog R1C-3 [Salvia miltiorrhiza]